MSWWSKVKEFESALDLSKSKKYVFRKWPFRLSIVLTFVLLISAWGIEGFGDPIKQNLYVACPNDGPSCDNPFYNNFELQEMFPDFPSKGEQVLPPGFVFGKEPSFLVEWAGFFSFCFFAGAFLVNHFLYNRKVRT